RGRSRGGSKTQAKAPAPPRWINSLQSKVGQAFSLPDFCHGLLLKRLDSAHRAELSHFGIAPPCAGGETGRGEAK
ncbi:MAG TPA: hypothetical protein VNV86_11380, partial [Candidatus Acidoferrum sp.]|nr:hypothetical protein [Candidatus Acidoferrum sp.]